MHGTTFAGYMIEGVLGRGGMGTVYQAGHPRLPRKVALKLLNRDVSADPELRARFEREATVVAQLDHPGIVAVEDRGIENGQLWLAMPYIEGTDASGLDARAMSAGRAVRVIAEIAAALDYAHSRGVLHRDVKPANILLTAEQAGRGERALLTDFGIARLLASDTQLTATGTFTATLAYASPEQLSGTQVDHRSDQYSLACTLFALLAGQAPFAAGDPGQVVAGHLVKPVPPLGRSDVPVQLDAVIARAMAKNPAERYSSAGEFAAAATHAVAGATVAAHFPAPPSGATLATHIPSPPQQHSVPAMYPVRQRGTWPAVWAVAVGFALIMLDSATVPMALPSLMREYQTSSTMAAWLVDGYVLAATVPLILAGRLGDRLGPKNIYLAGLALFTMAALFCALSADIELLIVGRALQGFGAALVLSQVVAVVIRTFAPGRRGTAMGLWAGAGGAVTLVGPLLGSRLVENLSVSWVFLLDLPLGIVALGLGAALIPALPAQRPGWDIGGVLLSGTGVLLLVLGLQTVVRGNRPGWGYGLLGAGLLITGLFLLLQVLGSRTTLTPKAVLRDHAWWLSGLASAVAAGALTAQLMAMSMYLVDRPGGALLMTGMLLIPAGLAAVVSAPLLGGLSDRVHPGLIPALGFALSTLAVAGVFAVDTLGYPPVMFVPIGGLLGVGGAGVWGPLAAVATRSFPPDRAGAGAGIHLTTRLLGSLMGGSVLLVWLRYRLGSAGLAGWDAVNSTLRHFVLLSSAVSLCGALVVILFAGLRSRRPRDVVPR
ncbi:MDR family MFS transporter [Nocardia sp. NPDC127579]|uniref:MDR family MFS transporter n=1 Tax=Nocardia sp. NPDC127579 TaxID=3345402 RepID=UPI00362AE5FC